MPVMNDDPSTARKNRFTLADLLSEQTRDLYDAELAHREVLRTLDRLSASPDLVEYLARIADDTAENLEILDGICRMLGVPPTGVKCAAMEGLVREAKATSAEWDSSAVRDAAIIANEQRIVHYQIAGYGTAKAFAKAAGLADAVAPFDEMLRRAHDSDRMLTRIACGSWLETGINEMAADGE
jgi:ferritin-like metal-binding protein YciE